MVSVPKPIVALLVTREVPARQAAGVPEMVLRSVKHEFVMTKHPVPVRFTVERLLLEVIVPPLAVIVPETIALDWIARAPALIVNWEVVFESDPRVTQPF